MGKGQRTKGNTKASNSRRTAELLGTEGVNSFIGFSSFGAEDEYIDSDFKVVLKKMSKKDCTTKIKALQEFQQLVEDKPESSVKTILVQWPRLYNKLAIDNDWRVREATHKSQQKLYEKIGIEKVATTQMMPIWLNSQYDSYTPVATAATASFEATFKPLTKKVDALVDAKYPILEYIKDMLLNQTIESVSEELVTSEDKTSRYNRLVSNCLQGLSALLNTLPSDSLAECRSGVEDVVNSTKFWKLAKYPDSNIRKAWFKLMSTLSQNLPDLFKLKSSKICVLTLGGLDEQEIDVIAYVWECALKCVVTIDDCWQSVSFRKAFYPQLRSILREGGRGSAAQIFPNLLPLLSRIPHESNETFIEFHKDFFAFLRQGLEKTVSKSQFESNAIIEAYMECLRFSICNTFIADTEQRIEFHIYLIRNELLSLVSDSISRNDYFSKTSLFCSLATLWLYLRKEDKYRYLIQQIRDKLTELCLKRIEYNDFKSFENIWRLFRDLFSDSISQKSDRKIRFRRDTDEEDYKSESSLILSALAADPMAISAINQISKVLIDGYHSNNNKYQYLNLLVDLFRVYTKDSFQQLLELLDIDFGSFWSDFIKEWLRNCANDTKFDENPKRIKTIIELTANLLTFVEGKQQKHRFLDEILSLNDPFVSESLFSTVMASNDKYLSDWLQSDSTGSALDGLISKLLDNTFKTLSADSQQDLDIFWKLFSHCFAKNSFNKLYIESFINKFSNKLNTIGLSGRPVPDTKFLVEFTCRLASKLFACYELCTSLSAARDLVVTIFSLNCRFDDPNRQLRDAWKTGLTNILKSNGCYFGHGSIVSILALHIRSRFNSDITSIEKAELVFNCAFELIDTFHEVLTSYAILDVEDDKMPFLSHSAIESILDSMILSTEEWNQLQIKCDNSVLHYDWLNRDILCDTNNCQIIKSDSFDTNGCPFVYSAVCTALLLERLIHINSDRDISPDVCQLITNQMRYLLTASAYLSIKCKSDKTRKFSSILSNLTNSLTNIFKETKSHALLTKLKQSLLELSIDGQKNSNQAFSYLIHNFDSIDKPEEIQYQLSFDNLTYNQIITFQQLSPELPQIRLKEYLDQSLAAFVSCERFIELEDGIAKLAVLHSCLKHVTTLPDSEDISETVTSIMETFCGLKSSNSDLFYHNNHIEANSELQFYCLISQVFHVIVDKYSDKLSQTHWDLIFLSTTRWIQNVIRQKNRLETDLSINIFVSKIFKLLLSLAKKFDNLAQNDCSEGHLFLEWQEFHSRHLFDYLITFYFHYSEKQMNFYEEILFNFISKVVVLVPYSTIVLVLDNHQKEVLPLQPIYKEYNVLYLPPEGERVLNVFSPLLLNSQLPVALSSHQLILRLIPFLLKDVIQPEIRTEDEDGNYLSPPMALLSLLQQTDLVVDSMLSEYSIVCCCDVKPNTDSFTYTLAYLLLWIDILEIFSNTCEENPTLRPQMVAFLKENSFLARLLKNLFRLMPLSTSNGKLLTEELFDKQFTRSSFFSMEEPIDSTHIQRLSFHLYYLILRQLPAAVREWFKSVDRLTTGVVNQITSDYFSPIVCSHEMEAVRRVDANKFVNMTVKARLHTREVYIHYIFEEMLFELTIHFPNNYPLDVIKIEYIKRIGVKPEVWRQWMLQLTTYLNYQNGSILDALTIFKKNLDQIFEGVDPCIICFYVLHGKDYSKPEKFCGHCRKPFHAACLHKWFKTSGNTLCPNCRQLWKNFYSFNNNNNNNNNNRSEPQK